MSYSSGRTKHVLQLKTLDGKMTELKMLNVVLDAVLIIIIMVLVVCFYTMVNDHAEENTPEHAQPGCVLPEHVQEQLLNGDGYWE